MGNIQSCSRLCVFYLQVPSPPGDEDEDFILVHHSDIQNSDKAEQVYTQLANILKEQREVKLQESNWENVPDRREKCCDVVNINILLLFWKSSQLPPCWVERLMNTHKYSTNILQLPLPLLFLEMSDPLPAVHAPGQRLGNHKVRFHSQPRSTDSSVITRGWGTYYEYDSNGTKVWTVCVSVRFEKMAESCKKSLEILKLAQSRALPPPKHHFEERSFHTVRWACSQNRHPGRSVQRLEAVQTVKTVWPCSLSSLNSCDPPIH